MKTIKSNQMTCNDGSKLIVEGVKTKVERECFELTENWHLNDMVRMAYNEYNVKRR